MLVNPKAFLVKSQFFLQKIKHCNSVMCGSSASTPPPRAPTDSISETNFSFFQFNWNSWHMQSLLGGSLLGVLLILLILYCGCTTLCGCQLPCITGRTGNRRRRRRWRGSAISLRDDVNSYPMTHLRSNINNNSQMITPAFTPEQWRYLTPLIQQQQRSLTNENRPALGYASPSTTRSSAPALPLPPGSQPAPNQPNNTANALDWDGIYERIRKERK